MLFLPLADDPNYAARKPLVNWGLIAINVLVYAWAKLTQTGPMGYDLWIRDWAYVPGAPRFETFFTSMFMHADFWHLAGNMLFLWVFGDNVEARLGRIGYLMAYLSFGLAAVLLNGLIDPDAFIPYLGASGAIFGVCGFYWLAFRENTVRVLIWLLLLIYTPVIRARYVLGAFFVLDFVRLAAQRGMEGGGGVAYAAHVGGFVAGLGLAFVVLRFVPPMVMAPSRRLAQYERGGWRGPRSMFAAEATGPSLDEGRALVQARRIPEAVRVFEHVAAGAAGTETGYAALLQIALIRSRVYGDVESAAALFAQVAREADSPKQRMIAQIQLEELGYA